MADSKLVCYGDMFSEKNKEAIEDLLTAKLVPYGQGNGRRVEGLNLDIISCPSDLVFVHKSSTFSKTDSEINCRLFVDGSGNAQLFQIFKSIHKRMSEEFQDCGSFTQANVRIFPRLKYCGHEECRNDFQLFNSQCHSGDMKYLSNFLQNNPNARCKKQIVILNEKDFPEGVLVNGIVPREKLSNLSQLVNQSRPAWYNMFKNDDELNAPFSILMLSLTGISCKAGKMKELSFLNWYANYRVMYLLQQTSNTYDNPQFYNALSRELDAFVPESPTKKRKIENGDEVDTKESKVMKTSTTEANDSSEIDETCLE